MANKVRKLLQSERDEARNLAGINNRPIDPDAAAAQTQLPNAAWPGGYTIAYYTQSGDTLCARCATSALDDPDSANVPTDYATYDEGEPTQCDECGFWLISSYGDPDNSLYRYERNIPDGKELSPEESKEAEAIYDLYVQDLERENRQLRARQDSQPAPDETYQPTLL